MAFLGKKLAINDIESKTKNIFSSSMNNLACNLLYNNGGEDLSVGFSDTCSIGNIAYNVRLGKRRWCSQSGCLCKQFYDRDFAGARPHRPCNESYLFTDWEWNAGENFQTGAPFYIRRPITGKVALLTTRFAGRPEKERKIVGFFKIAECIDQRLIIADPHFRLRLLVEETSYLNFWEYHRNDNGDGPSWNQKRFRYLEDIQIAAILHDLHQIVRNDESRSMIKDLLVGNFPLYAENRPLVSGYLSPEAVEKTLKRRKYGTGGESAAHKRLKNHIASHPELIGLEKENFIAKIEHPYVSGDMVDILFEHVNGKQSTVVEIELDNVIPGIHQAIKYRSLRCSQLNRPLNDPEICATVVAWQISPTEAGLCDYYGIRHFEHKI